MPTAGSGLVAGARKMPRPVPPTAVVNWYTRLLAARPPAPTTVAGTLTRTTSPGAKSVRAVPAVAAKLAVLPATVTAPAFRPPRWAEKTRRFAAEAAVTGSVNVTAVAELVRGAVRALATGLVLATRRRTAKAVLAALVPPGVVTVMLWALLAPAGTMNTRLVLLTPVGVTSTPFTRTLVAPLRLVPVSVTLVPATPLMGEKLAIAGNWVRRALTVAARRPRYCCESTRILPAVAVVGVAENGTPTGVVRAAARALRTGPRAVTVICACAASGQASGASSRAGINRLAREKRKKRAARAAKTQGCSMQQVEVPSPGVKARTQAVAAHAQYISTCL